MLTQEQCEACRTGAPKVTAQEATELLLQLPQWQICTQEGVSRLERTYTFRNFAEALAFTNQVGGLAEAEQHHPDILTAWGRVEVVWYTHKIGGLHRNDFICAARCDLLYKPG
ncbi:4a-hydroxytetrahydrobiopterin dehydratase [Pontibacter sp. JAM-7]|uniref:4a-hydroxytetrahydrobiopterin dehydratase n=1 Tax=Pontibacter sp. JAM-7 TaxID=3366581 RepID=UPI003AF59B23